MASITYLVRAMRARWHYRGNGAPCLACVWENGTEPRWQWIYCPRCDWGNR